MWACCRLGVKNGIFSVKCYIVKIYCGFIVDVCQLLQTVFFIFQNLLDCYLHFRIKFKSQCSFVKYIHVSFIAIMYDHQTEKGTLTDDLSEYFNYNITSLSNLSFWVQKLHMVTFDCNINQLGLPDFLLRMVVLCEPSGYLH